MSDIGRNSPCMCGSGKKYKRCCLLNKENAKSEGGNSIFPTRPATQNSKFLISHPSMPKVYSDSKDSLAYALFSLSMKEFLTSLAKGESQKKLDDSLIHLNRKSLLDCYFSRRGEDIYFNLYNEAFDAQLHIDAAGSIYYGSSSNEISAISTIYFLYRLITDNNCPWNFENIQRNWPKVSSIAKSLFNFKNQQNPIMLAGIILKTDLYTEAQIVEIGKSINNLKHLTGVINIDSTSASSRPRHKTLYPITEKQEDLFHFIQHGTIGRNYWWAPRQDQEALSFWNHVQFIFSDNIIFSIKDLLNHPYAVFIPKDLLPEKLSTKNKLKNYRFWNENNSKNTEQTSEIINISKTVLDNFINSKDYRESKIKLYFSSLNPLDQISSSSIRYIKIDQVEFLEGNNHYNWKINGNKVIGHLKADMSTIDDSSFIFSKDGNTLVLNSFFEQKEIFKKLAKRYHLNDIRESHCEISAKIEAESDIYQLAAQFNQNISNSFNVHLNLDCIVKIPDDNVGINIFLDQTNADFYQTAFNIEVKLINNPLASISTYNLSGVPLLLYRTLNGLSEGIGQFFYEYDNKDLAHQNQGDKRKNDLKLLRHSGVFKILLAEIIRYINTPGPEREKIKNFEKKLVQKALFALLPSSLEEVSLENDNQISSRVKGLIKEFCQTLCLEGDLETYLFSDGAQTYQVNLKAPLLKLLESILEWITYSYGESSLTKTQIKELNYLNKYHPTAGPLLVKKQESPKALSLFESKELSKGILASMGNNLYDVYISGQKIHPLSEDYFSSSIFMGENQGKINWFDLHPKIFFNGKEITYEQLQEMKEKDIIFFEGAPYHVNFNKMPKLKFLDRFWAKLKNSKNPKKDNQSNPTALFRQEKSLLLEVLSMRKAGIDINSCEEWTKICSDFDSLMENKTDDLSRPDFKVPLKNYQRIGTQWLLNLYKIGLGGILADDMGLGKTIQAIGFLEVLRLQGNTDYHMIVVPTSLIYNWTSEIKKFAPHLTVEIFESKLKSEYDNRWKKTPPKIILITYGLLTENSEFLNQYNWNSAIFDEAQNLKNISSQRSNAAKALKAKSTFCITGTPMENHYGEFYSLIDLCVPGALGEYLDFMRTFSMESFSSKLTLGDEINFLKRKTSPLVLRRVKSDILEQLPEKAESSILIPFEKRQKEIYRNIAISWNDKIKDVIEKDAQSNTQLQMLTALLRLRQICSNPSMVDKIEYNKVPPKFELLFESISEIYEKGESILVFTNFVSTLEEIEKYFRLNGYRTHSIHGAMSAKKRHIELQNFQENGDASILIMTLKTGGVGLNLTKASYVFHIEPWWNPAVENQATDRAHRLGQTKSVQVYRYLMKDSVEEKIQDLKSIKGQAFDALFKDKLLQEESEGELTNHNVFNGQLSYDDFQYLLT